MNGYSDLGASKRSDAHFPPQDLTQSVEAKALRIDTLQRGWTAQREESLVRDIILSTFGEDLLRLKIALDSGAESADLARLLFEDIDDELIRGEILAHIDSEAQRYGLRMRQVVSDIDDTVVSSIHEKRIPRGELYPGAKQFLAELAAAPPGIPLAAVFLTARPGGTREVLEQFTHEKLGELQLDYRSVLSGNLSGLCGLEAMAQVKFKNFKRLATIFPELTFVFIGDNGQADVQLAMKLKAAFPETVPHSFIHKVKQIDQPQDTQAEEKEVTYFDTYIGAAQMARALGVISEAALERVCDAALREVRDTKFESAAQRDAYIGLLRRDLNVGHS